MTLWILLAYIVGSIITTVVFTELLKADMGGILYGEDLLLSVVGAIFWPITLVFLAVYIAFSWTSSLIVNWLEGLMK